MTREVTFFLKFNKPAMVIRKNIYAQSKKKLDNYPSFEVENKYVVVCKSEDILSELKYGYYTMSRSRFGELMGYPPSATKFWLIQSKMVTGYGYNSLDRVCVDCNGLHFVTSKYLIEETRNELLEMYGLDTFSCTSFIIANNSTFF